MFIMNIFIIISSSSSNSGSSSSSSTVTYVMIDAVNDLIVNNYGKWLHEDIAVVCLFRLRFAVLVYLSSS